MVGTELKIFFYRQLKSEAFLYSLKACYIVGNKSIQLRGFKSHLLWIYNVTRPLLSRSGFVAEMCKVYSRK